MAVNGLRRGSAAFRFALHLYNLAGSIGMFPIAGAATQCKYAFRLFALRLITLVKAFHTNYDRRYGNGLAAMLAENGAVVSTFRFLNHSIHPPTEILGWSFGEADNTLAPLLSLV